MVATLKDFQLDKLKEIIALPKGKAAMYTEACVWCMDKNGHNNGVDVNVQFEKKNKKYKIRWPDSDIDIHKIRQHYNIDDALPFGAEAIAFFVCIANTDYDCLHRAIKKTGIDYWLGFKNTNPNLPFHNSGRLEVSGILSENDNNTIDRRIKEKLTQASQSEKTSLPVYIVVVAFDKPYAKMVVKYVNS